VRALPDPLPSHEAGMLNEQAYARLRDALLSGQIEPGTTLTLPQLAAQLGTSVMPVREAVTRLSAERAVVVLPKRGISVPLLDEEEADDIWSLRLQLEGEASARAARFVTPQELSNIRQRCQHLRQTGQLGDLHAVLIQNSQFQFAVYAAGRSPVLLQLIELLRLRSVPYCTAAVRVMLRERPAYFAECWNNHDALVEALGRRDARAARMTKQADIRAFRDFVRDINRRGAGLPAAGPRLAQEHDA